MLKDTSLKQQKLGFFGRKESSSPIKEDKELSDQEWTEQLERK